MRTNYYRAVNMSLFFTSSKMVVFLALLTYVLTGNTLTAEKVFVTSALINNVRLTMTLFFPFGIAMGSETLISCRRLQVRFTHSNISVLHRFENLILYYMYGIFRLPLIRYSLKWRSVRNVAD